MHKHSNEAFMQRCLQLAALGNGYVAPNPMVGAVLVHNNTIIGEGFHQKYGGPHAEVNCIADAMQYHSDKLSTSVMFVSLEPCSHYGKTPPCADLIIQRNIPNVVIGCGDNFDLVNGRGVEKLKNAGVILNDNVLHEKAVSLNKAFFTYHKFKRPYVILKWAQTTDGYIASDSSTGQNKNNTQTERLLISNAYTNRLVHKWRSQSQAIMIGANTAIMDNPILDNRNWWGPSPKKIIFDPNLKTGTHLSLMKLGTEVIVLNTIKEERQGNILFVKVDTDYLIKSVLANLYKHEVQSVFVEGGQWLLNAFIRSGYWDEARVVTNKNLHIDSGLVAPKLNSFQIIKQDYLFNDEITYFKSQKNSFIDATATGLL